MDRAALVIGISGGSGSGKTTVAVLLQKDYGSSATLLHMDDYYHPVEDVPRIEGRPCFDHPKAIDFKRLASDLAKLKAGKTIEVEIKMPRSRKPGDPPRKRVKAVIKPAPMIIVEGFLLLHDPEVRKLLDVSFFLESDIERSARRRVNQASNESWYLEHVVIPMHYKYVAPTARLATNRISVEGISPEEILPKVSGLVRESLPSSWL